MGKVLSSFNNGFPGNITRSADQLIETFGSKETTADIAFGAPVMLTADGSGVVNFTTEISSGAPTEARILGLAVRTAKTPSVYGSSEATYAPGELVDVLKRGTCCVRIKSGSPKPGNKVYWTPEGFTPTYTEHAVCEITNLRFRSARDFNNIAEVVLLDRSL